ncbi:cation diffusion facilitator family transporter [Actinomadura madurae]|uniref:cation diffusion facilitator family transporter n=1 Tax=Actinomadura madurae TaxID=1993 RepID=UPI0020274B73|nr:cation diffusion facilitator family transporter [Actinomadura madurae]URM94434.1 cation diffusion facilitator family transporter [Actinomadura madurae]URN05139.1 cation diffusion facilitator family transporter [Actinomadura madurae]
MTADRDPAPDGHGHGEGHGHGHAVSASADRRLLTAALVLILAYMSGEVVIGFVASSLALITDAAHMMTDAFAIALALVAMRIAARPPKGGYTFGLRRAEILSAQLNGLTLILLAVFFVYEGVRRLVEPPAVEGQFVFWTALAGIAVNIAATVLISRADRRSLNVEGAFQHILNDLFAFIATAVAGLVVWTTGLARADAVASLVVAALMLKAGYRLLRDAGRVLMEAAPAGMDPSEVGARLAERPCVEEVHDLHVWEVSSGYPALSAHVLVDVQGDCHAVRRDLQELLRASYGITHTTLEVDHVDVPDGGPHGHCDDPHGPRHVAEGGEPHEHAGSAPCDH